MAAPGDIGDLPEEGAIEGGLLHEAEALLQLAQGLVFLSQCLLQLQHLWGSPFSGGHQGTAWGQGGVMEVMEVTESALPPICLPDYTSLRHMALPESVPSLSPGPLWPLSCPLANSSSSIRNLAHGALFWEASHYRPSSAGLSAVFCRALPEVS